MQELIKRSSTRPQDQIRSKSYKFNYQLVPPHFLIKLSRGGKVCLFISWMVFALLGTSVSSYMWSKNYSEILVRSADNSDKFQAIQSKIENNRSEMKSTLYAYSQKLRELDLQMIKMDAEKNEIEHIKQEILDLKNELYVIKRPILEKQLNVGVLEPGSVQKYNSKNWNTLYSSHQGQIKKIKQIMDEKRDQFISTLDLRYKKDREKLEEYNQKIETQLEDYKNTLQEKRIRFMNQGYRIVNK